MIVQRPGIHHADLGSGRNGGEEASADGGEEETGQTRFVGYFEIHGLDGF